MAAQRNNAFAGRVETIKLPITVRTEQQPLMDELHEIVCKLAEGIEKIASGTKVDVGRVISALDAVEQLLGMLRVYLLTGSDSDRYTNIENSKHISNSTDALISIVRVPDAAEDTMKELQGLIHTAASNICLALRKLKWVDEAFVCSLVDVFHSILITLKQAVCIPLVTPPQPPRQ